MIQSTRGSNSCLARRSKKVGGIRDAALEPPAFTINLWPVKAGFIFQQLSESQQRQFKNWPPPDGLGSSQTEISNSTVRLEDGFLRSNGLWAKLTPPMSLVTDETSIYYDAR